MPIIQNGNPKPDPEYLAPTEFFDFDKPVVRDFTDHAVSGAESETEKAVKLYYAIRDSIRYDPYTMSDERETYCASHVIETRVGFCQPKANVLVACARAMGIPAAIGLADVTNHLCTERLRRLMNGSDYFLHHGYAALFLEGRWLKAAPAFNIELCDRFDVTPTEFDGRSDALLQEFDKQGRKHMEYKKDHGIFTEFPFDKVQTDFTDFYSPTIFADSARECALNAAKKAKAFENETPIG